MSRINPPGQNETNVVYLAASRKINQRNMRQQMTHNRRIVSPNEPNLIISCRRRVCVTSGRVSVGCARSPKAKISVGPDSEKCILQLEECLRVSLTLQTHRRLSRFSNCTHSERTRERESYLFLQLRVKRDFNILEAPLNYTLLSCDKFSQTVSIN